MTVLGIGIVPCAVCCAMVWFAYKKWSVDFEEAEKAKEMEETY